MPGAPAEDTAALPLNDLVARARLGGMAGKGSKKPRRAKGAVRREQEVLWVAQHITDDPPPLARHAPSKEAFALYSWVTADENNARVFWSNHYTKVMQKEKEQESQGYTDDQRKMFRLFEALERERPDLQEAARISHANRKTESTLPKIRPVEAGRPAKVRAVASAGGREDRRRESEALAAGISPNAAGEIVIPAERGVE